jgi:hypothetical protein
MERGFEIMSALGAIVVMVAFIPAALGDTTPDVCQTHDEKAEAASVDSYVISNLSEHLKYGFSQALVGNARSEAKSFFLQHISDKRTEICAAHLKLAEDLKTAISPKASASCGAAAVAGLLGDYANQVATTYEQNRQTLTTLLNAHLQSLKGQLFEIARGSTAGLSGTSIANASQDTKFEWIKQEASKMGSEAHVAWGAANSDSNPLVQQNLAIGREATRAGQEYAAAKARLRALGSCKK